MKEFLVILFLGKVVLLTQNPISIEDKWVEMVPDAPISAINSGASIQIGITSEISRGGGDIVDVRERILKKFPSGSIKAMLIANDGTKLTMTYRGNSLIGNDDILLSLYGEDGMPVGKEFEKVMMYSDVKIDGALIYWKNHKK